MGSVYKEFGKFDQCNIMNKISSSSDEQRDENVPPLHQAIRLYGITIQALTILSGFGLVTQDDPNYQTLEKLKDVIESLSQIREYVDEKDGNGNTPLHEASRRGCIGVIGKSIAAGALVDVVANDGETPLHLAVKSGNFDATQKLIEKGAKVNARNVKGLTALHSAAKRDPQMAVMLLANGADATIPDAKGRTALHCAAKSGNLETIKNLVAKGAHVDAQNRKGETVLHLAAKRDDIPLLVYLVRDQGAKVNIPNNQGKTALHLAARATSTVAFKIIFIAGAIQLTPGQSHTKAIKAFRRLIAETKQIELLRDNYRRTAVDVAVDAGHSLEEICQAIPEVPELFRLLL